MNEYKGEEPQRATGVCGDLINAHSKGVCGYGTIRQQYKFIEVMINTYFTHMVPMKVRVNGLFPSGSRLNDGVGSIVLESRYDKTIIKVIDIQQHNLNPDIIYPMSYLLTLPSIETDPNDKRFEHDIIFNVYNYLHFLNKHKIDFNYEYLIVMANIPDLDNAFWNGSYLSFGNGTAGHTPLTSSMIVAHELTHALTQQVCGLEYEGLSGALNESFSDVFGVCFEFYIHELFSSIGWELGSECGFLLRNMKNPHVCNQPEVMGDCYYIDPSSYHDNGGVHINSGIPNHVFYCIQEIIGYKRAFELWIRTLFKMNRYSQFKDFKSTLILVNQFVQLIEKNKLKEILDRHIF